MSNPQSPRYPSRPPFHTSPSSSAVLDSPYMSRGSAARPGASVKPQYAVQRPLAPDEIWGHYNNYRSNGLVGSAIFHILALGVILGTASLGHQVVQQAKQREVVTLIAPSPDT